MMIRSNSTVRPKTAGALAASHNFSLSNMDFRREMTQIEQAPVNHTTCYINNTRPYDLINDSYAMADAAEAHIRASKQTDPLNSFTETLRDMNNTEIFKYMKQCRLSVARLRKSWLALNEEIKSMMKTRQFLESAIEHVRKDLIINKESGSQQFDEIIDEAICNERQSLLCLKQNMETHMLCLDEHLQKLDCLREEVNKHYKERTLVTDLICQCLSQSLRSFDRSVEKSKQQASSKLNILRSSSSVCVNSDPRQFLTGESVELLKSADHNINIGKQIREQAKFLIKEALECSRLNANNVHNEFVRDLEKKDLLKKRLTIANAEHKMTLNKSVNWRDTNMLALGFTLGPEKYTNLKTYERLDRPVVRYFQKHPGNQNSEAEKISMATRDLSKSIDVSNKQIRSIRILGAKLTAEVKAKEYQLEQENSFMRKRKELSDHRWPRFASSKFSS